MTGPAVAPGRVAEIFAAVKNWGRWGPDDQLGALNFITPDVVRAATALATSGRVVSCSLPLPTSPSAEEISPAQHMMLASGDALDATGIPGFQQTTDYLGIACHGMGITHLDALCHILVGEQMYNGAPSSEVKSTGATRNSLAGPARGIVTRGVLLDIPRSRSVAWLEPGDAVLPEDLDGAAAAAGVEVRSGDALLVSTGRDARRRAVGPWSPFEGLAGLHAECLPWLAERQVAVLCSDGISDVLPPAIGSDWAFPIHQCAIAGMGIHLIDNLALDALAEACADTARWEFLFTVTPLRAEQATGCAVNPVAVL